VLTVWVSYLPEPEVLQREQEIQQTYRTDQCSGVALAVAPILLLSSLEFQEDRPILQSVNELFFFVES
jgi:hypothetical protein